LWARYSARYSSPCNIDYKLLVKKAKEIKVKKLCKTGASIEDLYPGKNPKIYFE
jgi:hypothetical protein